MQRRVTPRGQGGSDGTQDDTAAAARRRAASSGAFDHPLQVLYSTLPTVIVSGAIVVCLHHFKSVPFFSLASASWIYHTGVVSFLLLIGVFLYMQLAHIDYNQWQEHDSTRQAVQIATASCLHSLVTYFVYWAPHFGWLTPVYVIAWYVFVFTSLSVISSFF
ncbi:hypothetical protein BC940DRAFT_328785 [Gongronella butleri]|nr:hypothetical protein BC940DRAFT_328785 [Gongronella butleri]